MAIKQLSDGRWRVQIARQDMPRVRKIVETEHQAILFEQRYLKDNAPDVTDLRRLRELIGLWYELHGSLLSNAESRLRNLQHLCTMLKNPVACKLMPADILKLRTERRKTIEDKTWNNELGLLKSVYNKLLKLKVINYPNPIESVDPIRLQERELAYLSLQEIETLIEEIKARGKNPDTFWVVQLCLRTGARWGEAERLTRKQLNNNKVTYIKTKTYRNRTVPLDPEFFNALLHYLGRKGNNERCFSNCAKAFGHAIQRARIDLPRGQLTHICRHTYASHFMMQGGDILTLQRILGHKDIKMTLRYSHLPTDYLDEAVKRSPLANLAY